MARLIATGWLRAGEAARVVTFFTPSGIDETVSTSSRSGNNPMPLALRPDGTMQLGAVRSERQVDDAWVAPTGVRGLTRVRQAHPQSRPDSPRSGEVCLPLADQAYTIVQS